jgi:hypothetical protein
MAANPASVAELALLVLSTAALSSLLTIVALNLMERS